MKKLLNINPELPLEIKLIDEKGNYIYANKITVNYYDKNFNLLNDMKGKIKNIEIYFSRNTLEEIKLKVNDLVSLYIEDIDFEFLIDIYDDNFNSDTYTIEVFPDKASIIIKTTETDIEEKHNFIDIATSYFDYQEIEDVANFLYEDFKEDIYRELNIKTIGDYKAKLQEDESCIDYSLSYVEKKLRNMSEKNLIEFAQKYFDAEY